MAGTLLGHSQT